MLEAAEPKSPRPGRQPEPPEGGVISHQYQTELIQRICESDGFSRSKRLREFLLYVNGKVMAGQSAEISERQIAMDVYGRAADDYDSSYENAVRVQARILRQRLAEYFAGEGAAEPVTVEIPKGGYVPVFLNRPAAASAVPAAVAAPAPSVEEPTPLAATAEPRRWRWPVTVLAVLLVLSVLINIGYLAGVLPAGRSGAPTGPTLAESVVRPGGATLVVVPDTGYVVAQVLSGKSLTLDNYGEAAYRSALMTGKLNPLDRQFWGYLLSRRFSDVYAADFYGRLIRATQNGKPSLRLHHPRTLHLRDFAGQNVILLGSPRSNPWVEAFADHLAFQFRQEEGGREVVADLEAKDGSAGRFAMEPLKLGSGEAIGLLSVIPNPYTTGRVMLIAGATAAVTEAIGRIAVTPEGLNRLNRELKVKDAAQLEHLETVVSARLVGDEVKDWKVLAARTTARR